MGFHAQIRFVLQPSELSIIYFFGGELFWSLTKLILRRGSPSSVIVVVVGEDSEFHAQFNFVENFF